MLKKLVKTIGFLSACVMLMAAPMTAMADEHKTEAAVAYQTSTSMMVRVESEYADILADTKEDSTVIGQASKGSTYEILEVVDGEWAKVMTGSNEGYLHTSNGTIVEMVEEVAVDTSEMKRQEIAAFGTQFVGNRYVWGGIDPNRGADCSGFTMYIMKHMAGVHLSHSSRGQANEGRPVSAEEMRPGDLVFYASGSRINHVAMYIGDGKVVHASNEREGIKISPWIYRNPVRIVNVLGD